MLVSHSKEIESAQAVKSNQAVYGAENYCLLIMSLMSEDFVRAERRIATTAHATYFFSTITFYGHRQEAGRL